VILPAIDGGFQLLLIGKENVMKTPHVRVQFVVVIGLLFVSLATSSLASAAPPVIRGGLGRTVPVGYPPGAQPVDQPFVAPFSSYLPVVNKDYPVVETGKIVFVSNRDGNDEIYSMSYDGSNVTRLTNNTAQDGSPDWSPDGSKIAFSSNLSGEFEIYVMNADGSGLTQVTTLTNSFTPQWSPDGTRIAFIALQGYDSIIYTMNPDGTGLFAVTNPLDAAPDLPDWTPDGRIAFRSVIPAVGIYVINPDGTGLSPVLAISGLAFFDWSPNGDEIVLSVATPPNNNFDLYMYKLSTQTTTRLTYSQFNHNSVEWSPEGNYLIYHSWLGGFPVNWEIYTLSKFGYDQRDISNNPAADAEPDWTR
jgi:Tol biopolymer transport system component